jgi:lipopolysaccharide export system permease protein
MADPIDKVGTIGGYHIIMTPMPVFKRYLYRELIATTAMVAVGFLGLFLFFDFVDELSNIGKTGLSGTDRYGLLEATGFVVSLIPSRLYDLLPIAVLIGATMVMARFAQSSEFTALRTSGLSPLKALRLLLGFGIGLSVMTFVLGDYAVPAANKAGQLLKAKYLGKSLTGENGAWLKDNVNGRSFAINVGALGDGVNMQNLRIFEFDAMGQIASISEAKSGTVESENTWTLVDVNQLRVLRQEGVMTAPKVVRETHANLRWQTGISVDMVATALLKPDRMGTWDLYQYMNHLQKNAQSAQRYEIEFWRKLFYPVSCLVMLVLALPFAYLHFRRGSITAYVFSGVLIGISFFVVNAAMGYVGNLNNWQPWLAAAAPSLIYSLVALLGFGWLVAYR